MAGKEVVLTPFALTNNDGGTIIGDLRYLKNLPNQPVVIVCHSFMAFKDWGFFPYAAATIAKAGFVVVTFNFSRNGVVDNGKRITNYAEFEQNTFSSELHDLRIVVDAVRKNEFHLQELDPQRLTVLGHSRGGGIAIVAAFSDDRITTIVTWSAISTFDRWTDHQKEKWRTSGFLPLAKDSSISPLRLGLGLLHDIEQHSNQLSILGAAASLHIPWLLVHGKADVIVHNREAETLYAAADKTLTELVVLDHVGHLYNAASPEEDHYQTLDHIIDTTIHWLQRQLLLEKT